MDSKFVLLFVLLALASSVALATDAGPLQDFCVADKNGPPTNGFACKPPASVTPDDFSVAGIDKPATVSNAHGCVASAFNVQQIPGLNTLGLSMVRLDFVKDGVNPPHLHPRASEIMVVMEGTIEAGFITSLPEKRVISKVLKTGEAFVFPTALIHYQKNVGEGPAYALAALNSQNPGTQPALASVFGSTPKLPVEVLTKALDSDAEMVNQLLGKFK